MLTGRDSCGHSTHSDTPTSTLDWANAQTTGHHTLKPQAPFRVGRDCRRDQKGKPARDSRRDALSHRGTVLRGAKPNAKRQRTVRNVKCAAHSAQTLLQHACETLTCLPLAFGAWRGSLRQSGRQGPACGPRDWEVCRGQGARGQPGKRGPVVKLGRRKAARRLLRRAPARPVPQKVRPRIRWGWGGAPRGRRLQTNAVQPMTRTDTHSAARKRAARHRHASLKRPRRPRPGDGRRDRQCSDENASGYVCVR